MSSFENPSSDGSPQESGKGVTPLEKGLLSSEVVSQEGSRKRYIYRDNSLPDQPIVFETLAEGIIQADGKFLKEIGKDPARESSIGCTVEDLLEVEKKEFEKFQKEYLEKERITLAEYGEQAEQRTYQAYMEALGLGNPALVGKKILDIGAHNAFFASYCLKHGISDTAYSVDGGEESYTDQQVKKAIWSEQIRSSIEEKTKKALMQDLPYKDGEMNLVIIVAALPGRDKEFRGALTMEQDVNQSYDEIIRILAPGGEARIAPFYDDENDEYFGEWAKATKRKLQELAHIDSLTINFEEMGEEGDKRIIIRKSAMRNSGTSGGADSTRLVP